MIADNPWIDAVIRMLLVVMLVIGAALILIWLERKVAGRIQQRLGPSGCRGPLSGLASCMTSTA